MIDICKVTNKEHNINIMRKTNKDDWVVSSICREAGKYYYYGAVTTQQAKDYYAEKTDFFRVINQTLLLLGKLANRNNVGFNTELKTMLKLEQDYAETTLKKDRLAMNMSEHKEFMLKYIQELKDLGVGNAKLNSKNYIVYRDQLLKDRCYLHIFENYSTI